MGFTGVLLLLAFTIAIIYSAYKVANEGRGKKGKLFQPVEEPYERSKSAEIYRQLLIRERTAPNWAVTYLYIDGENKGQTLIIRVKALNRGNAARKALVEIEKLMITNITTLHKVERI